MLDIRPVWVHVTSECAYIGVDEQLRTVKVLSGRHFHDERLGVPDSVQIRVVNVSFRVNQMLACLIRVDVLAIARELDNLRQVPNRVANVKGLGVVGSFGHLEQLGIRN